MAKRALSPDQLAVIQAVRPSLARAESEACRVRIGCSGGADSMALAAAVAHLVRREFVGLPVEAVVVDHGLQPGSADIAAQVVQRVEQLGLSARAVQAQVAADSPLGLEAAAREARYQLLTEDFAGDLLVGHSLNDQAETVLLGLARGSGSRSLSGMAAQMMLGKVRVVRPLLGLTRQCLRTAALDWGVEIWDDPHNASSEFTRVKVRHRVLPVLSEQLGAQTIAALARTADLCRADADALDQIAAQRMPMPVPHALPISLLAGEPTAIATRMLRTWLQARGVQEPGARHIDAVFALVTDWHGQVGVDLPGGVRVARVRDALIAEKL